MAGSTAQNSGGQFNPYLSPDQQDLLLAALNSNNADLKNNVPSGGNAQSQSSNSLPQQFDLSGMNNMGGMDGNIGFFGSPQQQLQTPQSGNLGSVNLEESPFVDYLEADANFDFEPAEDGDDMIGSLPGDEVDGDDDLHEKRKSLDDDDAEDGGGKRQEGDDKTAKKPGRKPLTTEPTTKRKAQNRAAQRAFRERKEKHLKDLETKVEELENKSKSTDHENGVLRAQVARLQVELREYRKRLSLNSGGVGRSPPIGAGSSGQSSNDGSAGEFSFDFPRFGLLPGSHLLNKNPAQNAQTTVSSPPARSSSSNGTAIPGVLTREDSGTRSLSPKSQAKAATATKQQATPPVNGPVSTNANAEGRNASGVESLFSPSILQNVGKDKSYFPDGSRRSAPNTTTNAIDANVGPSPRVFQFNPGSSSSHTDSPESSSSMSQYVANSSSCTSPEPGHNSPQPNNSDTTVTSGGYVCHGNSEGEIAFCEMLNMACGNPSNPVPRAKPRSLSNHNQGANSTPAPTIAGANNNLTPDTKGVNTAKTPGSDINGIDWFANQNGGAFDPTLFGDYRESQDAVVGGGDFTGGFFSDAFNMSTPNFGSGLTPQPSQGDKLLETIEKRQNGEEVGEEEEVVPGDNLDEMMSCNNIWNQLQGNKDFQSGKIDIDNLCSELRAKARCSETGVVVDRKDVNAVLAQRGSLPNEIAGLEDLLKATEKS